MTTTGMRNIYHHRGRDYRFNDLVVLECISMPLEQRSGRLVQVRKGCGRFGSDQYFIRRKDGGVGCFENVTLLPANQTSGFYIGAGINPPVVAEFPPHDGDTLETEYSVAGEYPEAGFIIEHPKQPETPGAFSMMITQEVTQ